MSTLYRPAARAGHFGDDVGKLFRRRVAINDFDAVNDPVATGEKAAMRTGGFGFHG
ncbi:MAG: hypothetical protein V9H26_23490 [Verrucomicrobiota bacterium]